MGFLDPDLETLGAVTVYAVVFGFVFVESGLLVGFLLPGDSLLFAAGLLSASARSGVDLPVLIAGVLLAAVAGDAVGFAMGARLGRPWLERRMTGGRLDVRHLAAAETFYDRYGPLAIVAARFVPWVRTFTPILAGVARMPYARFLPANVVGALLWGAGITVLGHYAAGTPWLRTVSYTVAGGFVAASVIAGGVGWWRGRRRA